MSRESHLQAAIDGTSDLYAMFESIKQQLNAGQQLPERAEFPGIGTVGIIGPEFDEESDDEYVTVGFCLPDDVYAEIEDGTYGQLQAFRVYAGIPA